MSLFWCLYKTSIIQDPPLEWMTDRKLIYFLLTDSSQFHSVFGHQYCWCFDSLSKWNCSKTGFYGDQTMHTSPIDNTEGEHPTSNRLVCNNHALLSAYILDYVFLGFVSFTRSKLRLERRAHIVPYSEGAFNQGCCCCVSFFTAFLWDVSVASLDAL